MIEFLFPIALVVLMLAFAAAVDHADRRAERTAELVTEILRQVDPHNPLLELDDDDLEDYLDEKVDG